METYYILLVFFATLTISLATTLSTPEENPQENLEKLATANNKLALDLYQKLAAGSSKNIFFSPLSLSTAFGMLHYGAYGHTAEELRNVLGYEKADLPEYLVPETFHQYLTEALPSQNPSAYVLKSANSILVDKNLDLEPSYKNEVQHFYQATVEDVDFANDSQKIVEDVNNWVNNNTNGKIDKLLESVDPSTSLIILNAIYFKGSWKHQFDPNDTHPQTFYNYGQESKAKEVPMMRTLEGGFKCKFTPEAEVIELPYKGENFSMVIILPNEQNGLEDLERSLTLEKFRALRREMFESGVILVLPKFKIEYHKEMSGEFHSLGADSIFSPGGNFSGMTSRNIYVSGVQHKAVIEVNEEGSEAAAATEIAFGRSFTPFFVADHPFLFAIVDTRNDLIIFMGRVVNL